MRGIVMTSAAREPPRRPLGARDAEPRPDWEGLNRLALAADNLPRLVGYLGLRRVATIQRAALPWWPCRYESFRPWPARIALRRDRQAQGLRAGLWGPEAFTREDAADAAARAAIAARNRAVAASAVIMLCRGAVPLGHAAELLLEADGRFLDRWRARTGDFDLRAALGQWRRDLLAADPDAAAPAFFVDIDEGLGAWRTKSGGARGRDLISLAAAVANLPYGRAGWRIAALLDLDGVPQIGGGDARS